MFVSFVSTPLACVKHEDHGITSALPILTFCDGCVYVSSVVFHVGFQLKISLTSLTGGVDYRLASGLIPTSK